MQEELSKVIKMTSEEKIDWASKKGFSSFGANAEKFYESIDPEQFKSKEEMINFVNNSKYLELITDIDGFECVQIKTTKSKYRYFLNDDNVFLVGDKAIKVIDEDIITTHINNLNELKKIKSAEKIIDHANFELFPKEKTLLKSAFPGCGLGATDNDRTVTVNGRTYRIKLEIWVEDNYRWGENYAETFYKIISQRTTLGIFWNYQNYITYNVMLRSHFQNSFGNWQYHYINLSGTNEYKSVIEGSDSDATANFNQNTWIHFDVYNCEAYVPQTVNNKANFACN